MKMARRGFIRSLGLGWLLRSAERYDHLVMTEGNAIFLADLYIAGMPYYEGMKPEVLAKLRVGDELVLRREPHNLYDPDAIEVYTQDGEKLGSLPRDGNSIIASIMDAGVEIAAVLCFLDPKALPWVRAAVEVFELI